MTHPQWAEMHMLRPRELAAMVERHPIVYVPSGVIEWHDEQNPLGTDSLKMIEICRRTAARTGGVVHPPSYVGAQVMGRPRSGMQSGGVGFASELVQRYLGELFAQLEQFGFTLIVLFYGHTSAENINAHELAARDYMLREDTTAKVLCLNDVGPAVKHRYKVADHAAKWETSFMMATHPDRVLMEAIPADHGPWHGLDPRAHASSAEGERMYNLISEESAKLVEMALHAPRASLADWSFPRTAECWADCQNIEDLRTDFWHSDETWEDPWCDYCMWRSPGLVAFLADLKGQAWMRRRAEIWAARAQQYQCRARAFLAAVERELADLA